MNESARRRAFIAACAIVALGTLAVVVLFGVGDEGPPTGKPSRTEPEAASGGVGLDDVRAARAKRASQKSLARRKAIAEDDRRVTTASQRSAQSAALSVGRVFIAGLLDYEVGAAASGARAIRASASRRLAHFVLGRRPRVPLATRPPPKGRLASVELSQSEGRRMHLYARVRRAKQISGFGLVLEGGGSQWRVTKMTE